MWFRIIDVRINEILLYLQVGDLEMFERHQQLKESRNKAKTLEQEYEALSGRLEQEIQKNNRIKQDVENFKERENFLTKIKFLKMKKSWVVSGLIIYHIMP